METEDPDLEHEDPGLEQEDPGLEQEDPGLEQDDPGLEQEDPGLVSNSSELASTLIEKNEEIKVVRVKITRTVMLRSTLVFLLSICSLIAGIFVRVAL